MNSEWAVGRTNTNHKLNVPRYHCHFDYYAQARLLLDSLASHYELVGSTSQLSLPPLHQAQNNNPKSIYTTARNITVYRFNQPDIFVRFSFKIKTISRYGYVWIVPILSRTTYILILIYWFLSLLKFILIAFVYFLNLTIHSPPAVACFIMNLTLVTCTFRKQAII